MTEEPWVPHKYRRKPRPAPRPDHLNPDNIPLELNSLFPPGDIERMAHETGFIKRNRVLEPVPFFWAIVLGFGTFLQRTLAGLRRTYREESGERLAQSSWHERFTPAMVAFLKACVLFGLQRTAGETSCMLKEKLRRFQDILIQDNTIIRLHQALAKRWPATRSRVIAAGIKVALLISVVANGPATVAIHAERTADIKTIRIGRWVKDRLLLFDLGYYKFQLFARIKENGGFFISRLKDNSDPTLLRSLTVHRGQAVDLSGKQWKDVKPRLERKVLDAETELTFSRRPYAGKHSKDTMALRLVAIYDDEDGDYHVYLTNIPPDVLSAEDIAALYRVRWEVELVFKELKSRYALDVVKTRKPAIVLGLVWTAILTLIVSRRLHNLMLRSVPRELAPRYPPLLWSTVFMENGERLLGALMRNLGFEPKVEGDIVRLAWIYESNALDPHVNRRRLREGYCA